MKCRAESFLLSTSALLKAVETPDKGTRGWNKSGESIYEKSIYPNKK